MSKPLFSILHTSARPDKWRAVYDDWMSKAVHPEDVEYVLCVDPRWGFSTDPRGYTAGLGRESSIVWDNQPGMFKVVINEGRRCYVDGVNTAARTSSGAVLIVNADDQFACDRWDDALWHACKGMDGLDDSFVIDVNTGTPSESAHKVCQMPILSRKRYEDQGNEVFFHLYESMCADNDFREWAVQDGVLIDAYHLFFDHRHPLYSKDGKWQAPSVENGWDAAYAAQNRQEATDAGVALLKRRRAAKFQPVSQKRCIAMCYPGEVFQGSMHDALMAMWAHLALVRDFEVLKVRAYTTDPANTREEIRRTVMQQNPKPDLVLFMDDDNPLRPDQFDQLLLDLEEHPEVDGVAGWCWIYREDKSGFMVSCGLWSPDHLHWDPFPSSFAREIKPRLFECGGLPCLLMRISALEKAGDMPFLPIIDNRLETGKLNEDFAFFKRAEEGGATFLVDPKVHVPHLKYVSVEPVLPEDGAPASVKVACMMRVKNEARWIKRTIDSVRELCGSDIYVMEDGSSDDTRAVAERAGAIVLDSPFVGLGLDEARDKNWFMAEVLKRCSPDWILMPDGDEELEPGGCAKIRCVLETNPNVDCFALQFLYFWDSVEQIRVDGVYGTLMRQSLFRADTSFEFRPYYSGEGENHNHVGLHTSNAPGLGGRVAPLRVALLHYGYLHREDRIRKYRWILSVDPENEKEGYYLHTIQGDLPEVPADATLLHGGPLKLIRLPAHMIPKFERGVPGPRPLESEVLEQARWLARFRMSGPKYCTSEAECTYGDCPTAFCDLRTPELVSGD